MQAGQVVTVVYPDGSMALSKVKYFIEAILPGSCELAIERMVVDLPHYGEHEFTRSMFQELWTAETLPGKPRVTIT